MSTRQDVDLFIDFLRSTFVDADKESSLSALSATSTLRSIPSDATLEQTIAAEPVANPIPEYRKKPRARHIPFLSHLRRVPKPVARSPSLPAMNLTSGLSTIR